MKKSIISLIYLFLFFLLFYSCNQKNNEVTPPKLKEEKPLRVNLLSLTFREKQVVYTQLKPESKLSLWQNRLTRKMKENTYTNIQKDFINELYGILTKDMFILNSKDFNSFISKIQTDLDNRGFNIFDKYNRIDIFGSVDFDRDLNTEEVFELARNKMRVPVISCNCLWGTSEVQFCYTCTNNDCKPAYNGCGWFWSQQCSEYCKGL